MKQETTVYSGVIVYGRPIPKLLSAVLLSHASRVRKRKRVVGGDRSDADAGPGWGASTFGCRNLILAEFAIDKSTRKHVMVDPTIAAIQ